MELRDLPFERYYNALKAEVATIGLQKSMQQRGQLILDEIKTGVSYATWLVVSELLQEIWHMIQIAESAEEDDGK